MSPLSDWAQLAPALFSGFIPQINPPAVESLLPDYAAHDQKLQMELSMNGFPRSVSVSDSPSLNINTAFGFALYYKSLTGCFCVPEVTSLANGPAMTPDGRAAAAAAAELLLCLLHLYHKSAHCTRYNVDNVSVSSPSTQGHKTL